MTIQVKTRKKRKNKSVIIEKRTTYRLQHRFEVTLMLTKILCWLMLINSLIYDTLSSRDVMPDESKYDLIAG